MVKKLRELRAQGRAKTKIHYEPPKVEEPKVEPKQEVVKEDKYNFDPNKTYLVVNGEPKEIGKKSSYLLNMLIIGD